MGIPWPSRSHLGSDLAQTFHAGQFSRCHVSCCAARGAQVRLVVTTHRALGIIVPSAIKMQPCQRAAAQQQVGQLWPLPRGVWVVRAQGEVTMPSQGGKTHVPGTGWTQQVLGAQTFGELARPHTTFVHPLTVPKPPVPNHRARRKGPTGSSKDSDQVSLEAERRFCKGEMRLHEAQDSNWPTSPPYTATGPPGPIN